VFEDRVVRGIFTSKEEVMEAEWEKFRNERFHNL
jgi:hypothetical protein